MGDGGEAVITVDLLKTIGEASYGTLFIVGVFLAGRILYRMYLDEKTGRATDRIAMMADISKLQDARLADAEKYRTISTDRIVADNEQTRVNQKLLASVEALIAKLPHAKEG